MFNFNKTIIGVTAGIAGTLFVGYCIYFDNKRRSDPEYKKKLRERRREKRKNASSSKSGMPNLNDHEAIERYFLQEIQMGESLIARGDFENGVEHLANAIVVCGQPARLLQVLQSSLPAQVFALLIMKMQEYSARANADGTNGSGGNSSSGIVDTSSNVLENNSGPIILDDLE